MKLSIIFVGNNSTGSGIDAIRCCTRLGYRPVVFTTTPDRHVTDQEAGAVLHHAAEWSKQAIMDLCSQLERDEGARVAAVTTFSDPRVAVVAEAAQALGLPGLNPMLASACMDKVAQRQLLGAAGVAIPRWQHCDGPVKGGTIGSGVRFPVVVKPARGSGSVGVRLAHDRAVAERVIAQLVGGELTGRPEPSILIEEYVQGPQYSAELFHGRLVGLTRNYLGEPPAFIEVGHDFPATVPTRVHNSVGATAIAAVHALGVGWGSCHVEIRLGANGPRVIEVNPRLAGGRIPTLVLAATGIDLVEWTLRAALGDIGEPVANRARAGALRNIVAPQRGRLDAVSFAPSDESETTLFAIRRRGELVGGFGDFRDRVACLIAVADSVHIATQRAERARVACHVSFQEEEEAPASPHAFDR